MHNIVVLEDKETWSGPDAELWVITDEAMEKLEEGSYPKHLIEGEDVVKKFEIVHERQEEWNNG